MLLSKRNFITNLAATVVAAPAIVKSSSLMPLRGLPLYRRKYMLTSFLDSYIDQSFRRSELLSEPQALRRIDSIPFYAPISMGVRMIIMEDGKPLPLEQYKNDVVLGVLGATIDQKYKLPPGFSAAYMTLGAPQWHPAFGVIHDQPVERRNPITFAPL